MKLEEITFTQFFVGSVLFCLVGTLMWGVLGLPMENDKYRSCWTTQQNTRLCTDKNGWLVEP